MLLVYWMTCIWCTLHVTYDILCLSSAEIPAAAADITDEALDMRRDLRLRRRLISETDGDPFAIGITTTVLLFLTTSLGLVGCECISTMTLRVLVTSVSKQKIYTTTLSCAKGLIVHRLKITFVVYVRFSLLQSIRPVKRKRTRTRYRTLYLHDQWDQ